MFYFRILKLHDPFMTYGISNLKKKKGGCGTSLVVQWLRFHAPTAGGRGSIPGRGTKIPHVTFGSQKIKTKDFSRTDTTL